MFFEHKLSTAQTKHSEMVAIYNSTHSSLQNYASQLFSLRKKVAVFLSKVESLAGADTNFNMSFADDISSISNSRKAFDLSVVNHTGYTTDIILGISKAGGQLVREAAPDLAMWITTFGKASTGKAIKELKGIARNNAQKAWLGGGAKSTGGRGIEGGEALLAIIGPAAEIVFDVGVAIIIPIIDNCQKAKMLDRKTYELQHGAFCLTQSKNKIKKLIEKTEAEYSVCLQKYEEIQMLINEGDSTTVDATMQDFINICSSLASLLNQIV